MIPALTASFGLKLIIKIRPKHVNKRLRKSCMKFLIIVFALFLTGCSAISDHYWYGNRENPVKIDGRIYQTDSLGRTQYHKLSYVIIKDKIYEADLLGNPKYHKGSLTQK